MKTIKYLSIKIMAAATLALVFAMPAKAQITSNTYFNADWQFNGPLSNHYTDKASGWGMNFEGGYYVTPGLALGAFINYHTNNEYIPRQTFSLGATSTITTDQQHSIFNLPFGVTAHYRFSKGVCQPYVGVKLGANYNKTSSYFSSLEAYDKNWGFYASPEIGTNIYPWEKGIGFHVAAYYSYATNKATVLNYSIDGLSNIGFRLGIAF